MLVWLKSHEMKLPASWHDIADVQTDAKAKHDHFVYISTGRTGSLAFHHEECAKQQCSESQVIHFNPPFTKVPVVTLAFAMMDVYSAHNFRMKSGVSAVTTSSATLSVNTWADTVVYGSVLNWIACPHI
jgi:hypothetical protein